ncbi:MAG TPA: hypothetical protein VMV12_01850 [Candidatus Micrarchaeaceae archaeon]|nr:hypothetical protein [Candidatus Micrarchaeaceae archaeon]
MTTAPSKPDPLDADVRDRLIEAAEGVLVSARALASEIDPATEPWSAEGAGRLAVTCEGLFLDALELL